MFWNQSKPVKINKVYSDLKAYEAWEKGEKTDGYYTYTAHSKDARNFFARMIASQPVSRILSVGIGNGFLEMQLIGEGLSVTGIDISEKACDYAKKKGIPVVHGNFWDAHEIFNPGAFDAVLFDCSIGHLFESSAGASREVVRTQASKIFAQCGAMTGPGGHIFITNANDYDYPRVNTRIEFVYPPNEWLKEGAVKSGFGRMHIWQNEFFYPVLECYKNVCLLSFKQEER